jgi:AcrR family transcriptional regulator
MSASPTQDRRERERQRHRTEILDSARQVFCSRGYERATMADIAAEAQFAVGTLYRFFRSKESLFEALVLQVAQRWSQIVNAALDEPGNEVKRLERFIDITTRFFFDNHEFAKIMLEQSATRSYSVQAGLSGEAWEIFAGVQDRLTDLFQSGIAKKLFVDIKPRLLTVSLQGVTNGLLDEYMHDPGIFEEEDFASLRKRIFLDAVRLKPRIRLAP